MNRESNSYTIIYATVMVVLVAVALAFTAQALKEPQSNNVKIDKMQQILRSVRIDVQDKTSVIGKYKQVIKKELLVRLNGSIQESFEGDLIANNKAFDLNTANMYKEMHKQGNSELAMPLYVAEVEGDTKYIVPLNGAGLWGPIWGYISINEDGNTVYGADFGHQGETPGLGAEITTAKFIGQFADKHLFSEEEFLSIAVVKPGKKPINENQSYVDGISGGTLTSNGVNNMLQDCIKPFVAFLSKRHQSSATPDVSPQGEEVVADSLQIEKN